MGPPSGSDLHGIGGGALPGSPVFNGLWGGGGGGVQRMGWSGCTWSQHHISVLGSR